jgi:hypothetical protein
VKEVFTPEYVNISQSVREYFMGLAAASPYSVDREGIPVSAVSREKSPGLAVTRWQVENKLVT